MTMETGRRGSPRDREGKGTNNGYIIRQVPHGQLQVPLGTLGDSVGPTSDLFHPRDQEASQGHCPVGDSVSLKDRNSHNKFTESFHNCRV